MKIKLYKADFGLLCLHNFFFPLKYCRFSLSDFQNLFLEVTHFCSTVLKLQAVSCVAIWLFTIYSNFLWQCERITHKIRDKGKMEEHNDLLPDVNPSPEGIGMK